MQSACVFCTVGLKKESGVGTALIVSGFTTGAFSHGLIGGLREWIIPRLLAKAVCL